jgi:integrase
LENSTDLHYIQQLLGHASTKTTKGYIPLTKRGEEKLKSPLDFLEGILEKTILQQETKRAALPH